MLKELLSKIDAKLLRRFGYYFGGLALGVVALTYINKQKGTTFNYGPTARVLSQIRLKDTLKISDKAQEILTQYHLDSLDIQYMLHKGDWNRDKSHVHQKPCPDYWIDATIGKKINNKIVRNNFSFIIERCEYTATITDIKVN
ncbi:hypothetical protein [Wenyingzhuangia marina]|uniref:DUF4258 domain-containing protein n=1 Tax=Wenyingzhuangia marina TaxID=1195760 RepID=A0A1M5W2K8_9FLAO|nr:hypothetical protein [Wenyingzhuangia marina]GGF76501.1 hypothetical protein GCM10011397_19320 [Wenyingzhuangia marina]SHH81433.1 hypothetical protein SAMN05444281_2133 [Wenyingzhuangia marina]